MSTTKTATTHQHLSATEMLTANTVLVTVMVKHQLAPSSVVLAQLPKEVMTTMPRIAKHVQTPPLTLTMRLMLAWKRAQLDKLQTTTRTVQHVLRANSLTTLRTRVLLPVEMALPETPKRMTAKSALATPLTLTMRLTSASLSVVLAQLPKGVMATMPIIAKHVLRANSLTMRLMLAWKRAQLAPHKMTKPMTATQTHHPKEPKKSQPKEAKEPKKSQPVVLVLVWWQLSHFAVIGE